MKPFNKVVIIGVGLIGGSIGLAIKRKRLAREVIGVCRHKSSLQKAKQVGAIDRGALNYKQAVKGADLVILASPIRQIIKIGAAITPYLKKDCLVTDVGSTKQEVVQRIEKALQGKAYFVGGHPLAGSEKRGAGNARADLFTGTKCILTKTKRTKSSALKMIVSFWKKIGCQIRIVTPQRHDEIVALISHLPHLSAVQLVKEARGSLDFASSGFFATTRIASSDTEVWTDIFLTNKKFISQVIDKYIAHLRLARDLIRQGNSKRLSAEFKQAKFLRDGLQK